MNLERPAVAAEYGREAKRAFRDAGGPDLARQAIADPIYRGTHVRQLLTRLDIEGLVADTNDVGTLLAAAELCRAAGSVALPYPVVGDIVREHGLPVTVLDSAVPRVDHGDVFERWWAIDLSGATFAATPAADPLATPLGAFVVDMRLEAPSSSDGTILSARVIAFTCMVALGIAQEALRLTIAHVGDREQFGRPIGTFQSVQFRLANAATALAGLDELASFTVSRLATQDPAVIVDALGLRLQMIGVTREVMRTAHQLHGAIGFCDEHDLSILSRGLQPLVRLPASLPVTNDRLLDAVETYGFDATFPVSPAAAGQAN